MTQEEALKLFIYDDRTGDLKWAERTRDRFESDGYWKFWNSKYAFKIAGSLVNKSKKGCLERIYWQVLHKRKKYLAHRLIWFMAYGYWPNEIDHINGDTSDNRMGNLREVDSSNNKKNMKLRSDNESGCVGVYYHKLRGKWCARITSYGEDVHIGLFSDFDDAVNARKAAEREYGFHKNHGRKGYKELS